MAKVSSLRPTRLASRDNREGQWCVNIPSELSPTGKRQRLFFATRFAADTVCEQLKTRKINFGHSLSTLSAVRIAEASTCFTRLERDAPGITLTAAVTGFLEQHRARTSSVSMSVLWERFLASKADASPTYRQELTSTFRRFELSLAGLIASDVSPESIESALTGFPPAYRNAAMRYLRAAFNFGVRSGWLFTNPIDRMEFGKIVRDQVEVIAPATVEKLLFDALANDRDLVPFLVFAFYTGVRPEGELSKLLWTDIDLAARENHVTIRATVAKKRRKRWIDLSNNALAWLEAYRAAGGETHGAVVPFSPSTLRRKRRRNARAAGLDTWPQQGARHTFCSSWLAKHGDINRLVVMAGHESASVLWNHYYQAVTPADAAAFWSIFPPAAEERRILEFTT
jgi:integrase